MGVRRSFFRRVCVWLLLRESRSLKLRRDRKEGQDVCRLVVWQFVAHEKSIGTEEQRGAGVDDV